MPGTTHAVGTTATEAEILAATQAAIAAGKDPFGDDDDTAAAADDAGEGNSAAAALNQEAAGQEGELTAEQLAAIAAEGEEGKDKPMAGNQGRKPR